MGQSAPDSMMARVLLALLQLSRGLESYSPHSSVEVREVKLPLYGVEGQQAVLQCIYNSLQPVYSVKWYKNGKEFFSYLPGKPDSPVTTHHVPGINLDTALSDHQSVFLTDLSQASTGRYRCEVSGEAPMFATDTAFGDLLVVVTPKNGPRISGLKKRRYSIGESLDLNCSSELTLPPANLTWYINQRPVPTEHLIKYPIVNKTLANEEKLHTATLGLRHKILK